MRGSSPRMTSWVTQSAIKTSPCEVRCPHVRIVDQLAPAAGERERAGFQEISVVAHVQRGGCVLLHHQDGRAGGANAGDDVEGALDNDGGKAERRLVEHDELGPRHHGAPCANNSPFPGSPGPSFAERRAAPPDNALTRAKESYARRHG